MVDLNTNTVAFRNDARRMTPQAVELLEILKEKYPETVSMERIIARLVGPRDLKNAPGLIRKIVGRAREQSAGMGLEVHNVHSLGYRLVINAPMQNRTSAAATVSLQ